MHFGISQTSNGVLAYSRILDDQEVVVIANTSTTESWEGEVIIDAFLNQSGDAYNILYSNKVTPTSRGKVIVRPQSSVEVTEVDGITHHGPVTILPVTLQPMEIQVLNRERVVSTGFAQEMQADVPLDRTMPLSSGQRYYFWLEIGEPIPRSTEEVPPSLPESLSSGITLTVALFAFPGHIQTVAGEDIGELQLRADGSVIAAHQPSPSISSLVSNTNLARRLLFPVRAPDEPGTFHLRCNIYYEQILIQSWLISARVMRTPQREDQALHSIVDYALLRKLDPTHLVRLEPHRLSIMQNSNTDGTHSFHFWGAENFGPRNVTLDGQALQDMLQQARGVLRQASWGDSAPWQEGKNYRYEGPRDLNRLAADLRSFAIRGWTIYEAIINRIAGNRDQAEALADLMRTPGFVQIAPKQSPRFIFPAALLYDYGFDANAGPITLCRAFVAALDHPDPLESLACFQGNCPSRGARSIICPSGFWGYRHQIGLPFSVETGLDTPAEIAYQQGLQFTIAVSTDPNFELRPRHEEVLRALRQDLRWNYAATREETLQRLQETQPHVVYFYCHGGIADNIPYIQVGARNERGITRADLRYYKKIRWRDSRPLVFINGCRTTALEPEMALEFVSAFVENASASGVIGTEITVFEPLARTFAEECLQRFTAGLSIGEAVRIARLKLLKEGNPLGLVYIPYVMASLRLKEQAAGMP
jgi:hypothetical protein